MKRVREQVLRVDIPSVATSALRREQVQTKSFHRTRFMEGLDLPFDPSFPYGVYVLRCAQAGQLSIPCYYGGFGPLDKLAGRILGHFDQVNESARFTKKHRPVGVEFFWPARNRGAEAYVFYFLLEKYENEDDILKHVLVGGWTQTDVKPLGTTDLNTLQREYRMLKGRCLKCGLPERTISSCFVCSAKSKASPATPPVAKAGASSTSLLHPAAKSCPSGKAAALLDVQRTVYPKAAPAAAAPDWDARAEFWFAKNPQIVFDA